jgi:OOP family OmpA-OmpF porin
MKKFMIIAALALTLASCKKDPAENNPHTDTVSTDTVKTAEVKPAVAFDAKAIPLGKADIGKFPYFTAPDGSEYTNGGGEQKGTDQVLVPLNDVMVPIEGPAFRAVIHSKKEDDWNQATAKKSFADRIMAAGGVKISDKKVPQPEVDRVKNQVGTTMDYWNEPVQVYAIKKVDGTIVFVQICTNTADGGIVVTETKEFM